MVSATVFFLLAAILGHGGYVDREVEAVPLLLNLVGFGLLTLGGWLGGSIVFVHGMRVLSLVGEPAAAPSPPSRTRRRKPPSADSEAERAGGLLELVITHVDDIAERATAVGDAGGRVDADARRKEPLVDARQRSQLVVSLDEEGRVRAVSGNWALRASATSFLGSSGRARTVPGPARSGPRCRGGGGGGGAGGARGGGGRRRRSPSGATPSRPAAGGARTRGRRRASAPVVESTCRAAERPPVPEERTEKSTLAARRRPPDDGGRRPAAVEDVQRLVDDARPEQSEPGVDGEDVEAVVRHRAGRDRVEHALQLRPIRPRNRSSTCRASVARPDAVEQLVADPVRLDDARVERVGDPVRAGDQRQVRPGALERPRELGEAAVRRARRRTRAASASRPRRRSRVRSAGTRSARRGAARAVTT